MSEDLPSGWAQTDIGTLGRYINGRGFGKAEWKKAGLPIIRIQNLNDESASFNYSDQEHEEKYRVNDDDLLVAWAASLGVYVWKRGPAWLNQHIFRVEVEERAVTKTFLYYALKDALAALYKKAHGSGMVHITKAKFDRHPLKLPPLNEQVRIVSKIDELFSRIDEGERALARVSKLVERYRQSVLKAAVTGELTRSWREARKAAGEPVESGEALLARILTARRQAWEQAELAKMQGKGITPKDDAWKKKYSEPPVPSFGLNDLFPEEWAQLSLEQATRADRPIAYGVLQPGKDVPSGIPMIRICDVADGIIDQSNLKRVAESISRKFPRTLLQGREVLLTLVGTIGRTAIVPDDLAGANVARAVGVLSTVPNILPEWLEIYLRSEGARQLLVENAREVARKTLNLEQLREYAVPIPCLDEQREVVSRVSELLSRADAAANAITKQVSCAGALRQSTLKSAFIGKLVPHGPKDEPASILLERIAAERVQSNTATPKRGRKPKTSA